eukprot:171261-Chlamydomonas_euryale.AAC.4
MSHCRNDSSGFARPAINSRSSSRKWRMRSRSFSPWFSCFRRSVSCDAYLLRAARGEWKRGGQVGWEGGGIRSAEEMENGSLVGRSAARDACAVGIDGNNVTGLVAWWVTGCVKK